MKMERRAFVLLSGGLDSTTCLFKAIYDFVPETIPWYGDHVLVADSIGEMLDGLTVKEGNEGIYWVEAISIDYGQRHIKEAEYAKKTCDILGIKHTILDVGDLLKGKSVMLSKDSIGAVEVPNISYGDIKGVSPTYVPFRNGLLLSAATAHAQKWVNERIAEEAKYLFQGRLASEQSQATEEATREAGNTAGIYFGAHTEDAANWAYPDCTPEFIGAMANAIYIGSYYAIRLYTPLEWLDKAEIIHLGNRLDVPYGNTWSCYKGEELHCGTCPTCRARKDGFVRAKIFDPTEYAA